MAVTAATTDSVSLLQLIRQAILNKAITTWTLVQGQYLTHSVAQWENKAFFLPKCQSGLLVFNIVAPKGINVSTEVYAIYHGRFIEMLLAHFDKAFTQATASALPIAGDIVQVPTSP
jgi:drug/metabolite transporter superfamily protein YnfA